MIEKKEYYYCLIIDSGVGLTEKGRLQVFHFAETSSLRRWDCMEQQQSYASPQTVPLGGLGVGLPLSSMMMQMFGGDLLMGDKSGVSKWDACGSDESTTGCIATIRILKDIDMKEKKLTNYS